MNKRLLPGLMAALAAQHVPAMNLVETYENCLLYTSDAADE